MNKILKFFFCKYRQLDKPNQQSQSGYFSISFLKHLHEMFERILGYVLNENVIWLTILVYFLYHSSIWSKIGRKFGGKSENMP